MAVDMDARYRVEGMPGVAWWLKGYAQDLREVEFECEDEDGEPAFAYDYEMVENTSMVIAVMVGDDREHTIDVDDLVKISDDDYCSGCGQIGCPWGAHA